MATTISYPVAGYDPRSELKVYSALKSLDDDWNILHSIAWLGARGSRISDGEADFVLIHKDHGVVVVEVKGGGVDLVNGRWVSEDRYGRVNQIKNPFEQATASKSNLHKWLKERVGLFVPTCHAVAFPDIKHDLELGPACPAEIVWDREDIPSIAQALACTLNHWRQKASMSSAEVQSIIDALAPTVSVRRTLADAAHDADAGLLQLTNEQIRAFAMTRKTPRAVVFGGAGTGKTVLACEKARQLRDEGNNVVLTCFNELLARRLSTDKSLENITTATFHSLCFNIARSAGLEIPNSPDSKWWTSDAPLLLMEGAEKTGLNFDAVVVDEGQDFSGAWFEALEAICASGGAAPFYIFADENQKLWDRDWVPDVERLRLDLTTNCRNSRPISTRVAAISGTEINDLGVDGPPAKWTDLTKRRDAPRVVQRAVERLLGQGFAREDIVVLCESPWLVKRLRETAVADTGFCELGRAGVATETIGRFKGLEALAVVVVLDSDEPGTPDRSAYVGFSRARSLLNVVASPSRKPLVGWN